MKTTIEINDDNVVVHRDGAQTAVFQTDKPYGCALRIIEELRRERDNVA